DVYKRQLLDLTKPLNSYWLLLGFQPASRIAWMALLYGVYAAVLIAELLYVLRYEPVKEVVKGLATAKLVISLALVIVSLMLYPNLGQVFGVMTSVPGWFGAHMGLLFLIGAFYLGAAGQALFLYPYIKHYGSFFAGFYGRIMIISTALLTVAIAWIFITASHLPIAWVNYEKVLFSVPFWLIQVLLGIVGVTALALVAMSRGYLQALPLASLFAIAATAYMSYYIIVSPQIVLPEVLEGLTRVAEYHIARDELMVIFGATLVGLGAYSLGMGILPLGAEERPKRLFILK
ncbi:MAG: polysulfide reductase NrfD, partial [Acidilobaceae archaeon]|nr:polysulfide reductase NrfD [Acidilobaceae archaeon]